MQRVRQKNTSAESALRRELHARGRYDQYDVYFCVKSDGGTVIARRGDDAGATASYPLFILFRPLDYKSALASSKSFRACSEAALSLHLSGRIRVRFEVTPSDDGEVKS